MNRGFLSAIVGIFAILLAFCVSPERSNAQLRPCTIYATKFGLDCSNWINGIPPAPTPTPTITPSPAPTPLPTATPNPVPAHIMTWAYDEYGAQGSQTSPTNSSAVTYQQVQTYLDYAEGGYGNYKASADCDQNGVIGECQSVFYSDTAFIYYYTTPCNPDVPGNSWVDYLAAHDEGSFLHLKGFTDSAHRITGSYSHSCSGTTVSSVVYAFNRANATAQSYLNSYFQTYLDGNGFDVQFSDDTSTTEVNQTYGPGGSFCKTLASECFVTNLSYVQEWPATTTATADAWPQSMNRSWFNSMKKPDGSYRPQIFNGLCITTSCIDGSDHTEILTGGVNNPLGGIAEGAFDNHGTMEWSYVPNILKTMMKVGNLNKLFVILDYDTYAIATETLNGVYAPHRVDSAALIWLGFYPNSTVWWENDESDKNYLAVWPEEMLFPTHPVQSMTTGATDLQVATGVYRREFTTCYRNAVLIGPCAAILNTTSAAVTTSSSWFTQNYSHEITLAGGDVLSGGTTNLTGATFSPGATSIPAQSGVLLSQ